MRAAVADNRRDRLRAMLAVLNVTGLVLIIFSIVFVVVVADTMDQLTVSVGVLGTIAGYLFGSLRAGPVSSNDSS